MEEDLRADVVSKGDGPVIPEDPFKRLEDVLTDREAVPIRSYWFKSGVPSGWIRGNANPLSRVLHALFGIRLENQGYKNFFWEIGEVDDFEFTKQPDLRTRLRQIVGMDAITEEMMTLKKFLNVVGLDVVVEEKFFAGTQTVRGLTYYAVFSSKLAEEPIKERWFDVFYQGLSTYVGEDIRGRVLEVNDVQKVYEWFKVLRELGLGS